MRPALQSFAIAAGVVTLAGAVLAWQQRETAELQRTVGRQRGQVGEHEKLQKENRRLAASQPTDAEMEELVARLMKAEQLKTQLTAMRRREEAAVRSVAAASAETPPPVPSLLGKQVGFEHWQNVGQATPDAAFETALWAAAHGDLDSLAGLLAFDGAVRTQAAALFARMPAAMRSEVATPERLISLLTAMDVPRGRASILAQHPGTDGTKVVAQLFDATGKMKLSTFSLQADGDRWRLVVPAAVVQKYASWLEGSSLTLPGATVSPGP